MKKLILSFILIFSFIAFGEMSVEAKTKVTLDGGELVNGRTLVPLSY